MISKTINHLLATILILGSFLLSSCSNSTNQALDSKKELLSNSPSEYKLDISEVSFNRHVRPVLSDRCFACHGPDADNQESPFRLDTEEASQTNLAAEGETPRFGIVPGKPNESLVISRILSTDPHEAMPPAKAKKKVLTKKEIAYLTKWIEQGAKYEKHWAFVTPKKPALPEVKNTEWIKNDIDQFILAKLESKNIKPSPEADKETLIRRLCMDLIGLPPTPKEIDAFINDNSETAYDILVDKILASPHYGERMAIDWLDVARYGDTNAIHVDFIRSTWPYRDWVINAFNKNMPYDQFVTEQLAGDLLPNATTDQKIATCFNRNHGITDEGGAINEEWLIEYAVDRVSTMGSAFMGLSTACARCHDHKFDPISQDDFYSLMSFFNNIPERGLERQNGTPALAYAPNVTIYTEKEKEEKANSDKILNTIKQLLADKTIKASDDSKVLKWGKLLPKVINTSKTKLNTIKRKFSDFDSINFNHPNFKGKAVFNDMGATHIPLKLNKDEKLTFNFSKSKHEGSINVIRVESSTPFYYANEYARDTINTPFGDYEKTIPNITVEIKRGKKVEPIKIIAGYSTFHNEPKTPGQTSSNWQNGLPRVAHTYYLELEKAVDLKNAEVKIKLDYQGMRFPYKDSYINDLAFHVANNPHGYNNLISLVPFKERTQWQKDLDILRAHQKAGKSKTSDKALLIAHFIKSYISIYPTRCMVMEEKDKIEPTYVLNRGVYDQPLKDRPRERMTPAAFDPMPDDAPKNRLGLAQWLTSADNPLTARVSINRFWQQLFQHGIVKTSEDFGLQSEVPTHPLLLDYLAVDYQENGWDIKRMIKKMVSSATYKQSSKVREDLINNDPANKLLARSPRYRFPAEVIRNNALSASGLLNDKIGGPSVKPYQPAGLWEEKSMRKDSNFGYFTRDTGHKLYRRGIYTFWKQASPPPQMELMDAPSREACTTKRRITNTPLQALMLMNDETYLEMSRELATRLFNEIKGEWKEALKDRITLGLRLTTGRKPTESELESWTQFANENLEKFNNKKEGEAKDFLSYGEKPKDDSIPVTELAALTFSMSAALNLDETITRD